MDVVLRSVAVYAFLLVVFRIAGKRTLGRTTTFDLVLLLIVSEATQQALLGKDTSILGCFLVVATLIGVDITLSALKRRFHRLDRILESVPVILAMEGRGLPDRMKHAGVDEDDILAAARDKQGLERMDQIQFAVLERSGEITIIPRGAP